MKAQSTPADTFDEEEADISFLSIPPMESYRCPGCGQMVNNRDLEAIRLHHAHVLHPVPDGRYG